MSDTLLDSLLSGGPVKVTNKSDNFVAGSGLVVLRKMIYDGPPKFQKTTFVAEWQVVTSESSGDLDAAGNLMQPNPTGSIVGYVQHPNDGSDAAKVAPGNIKSVVMALGGLTEEEADSTVMIDKQAIVNGAVAVIKEPRLQWVELLNRLKSKDQPGVGILCRYTARLVATKADRAKGLPKHQWHTFAKFESVPNTEEQVARFAKIIAEGKKVTAADIA